LIVAQPRGFAGRRASNVPWHLGVCQQHIVLAQVVQSTSSHRIIRDFSARLRGFFRQVRTRIQPEDCEGARLTIPPNLLAIADEVIE
jgi:hypothetical protein